jgi:hypothetical protein
MSHRSRPLCCSLLNSNVSDMYRDEDSFRAQIFAGLGDPCLRTSFMIAVARSRKRTIGDEVARSEDSAGVEMNSSEKRPADGGARRVLVRQYFEVSLPIPSIFEAQNVAGHSEYVGGYSAVKAPLAGERLEDRAYEDGVI